MMLPMVMAQAAVLDAPTEIQGCVLWLDAADANSLGLDGGGVAQWMDKSGGGNHVAQGDASHRPVLSSGLLNGRTTLRFNGNEWLGGPAVLAQGAQQFGYYIVWQKAEDTSVGVIFEQSGEGVGGVNPHGTRASFLSVGHWFGFCGEFNDAWDNFAMLTPNDWKVSGLEYNGNVWNTICLDDASGTKVADANRVVPGVQQVGAAGIRVGNQLSNNAAGHNGDIAEIIVFDRVLSDMERERILYYLQEKWQVGSRYVDGMWVSFEHGWYPEGWVAQGSAFEYNPTASTRTPFNKQGDWFVNTFDGPGNTDGATGTLTGAPFVLANNTLRLLVGGGYQENPGNGFCQVRLERQTALGGWEIVRKATGAFDDFMRETRWNVDNLRGQTVRLTAEDSVPGGWGYISFDALRLIDEPIVADFYTDFSGGTLPAELVVQRPAHSPTVELTQNQTLRLALPNYSQGEFDLWVTMDAAPKVLLQTMQADRFTLQTHQVAQSSTDIWRHTGLILNYEAVGTNEYLYWLFGVFGDGEIRMEKTAHSGHSVGWRPSQTTDVYLRVDGYQNQVTFSCSEDGVAWVTVGSGTVPDGTPMLNAGLFLKSWSGGSTLCEAEFDELSYTSSQVTPNGPLDIPGCVLWLDAADSGTLAVDGGGGVSLWKDKSGWDNDVQQTDVGYQPLLSPASLNGLPTVQFNGHAYLAGPQALTLGSPQFSYYVIWRRNNIFTGNANVIFEQAGGGHGSRASLITLDNYGVGFCGEENDAFGLASYALGAWKLSALEFNGRPLGNIYLDDDSGVKVASIDAERQRVGIEGVRVGCKLMGTGEFLDGDVAEILVFKRVLTAAERYNVLQYLQAKWGVGDNYAAEPEDIGRASLTAGNKPMDLHGATEIYETLKLTDTAHVTNGTLVITKTIAPSGVSSVDTLTLGDAVTLEMRGRPTVHVLNDLTLGEDGVIQLLLPEGATVPRTTLFTFGQLLDPQNLATWTVSGVPPRAQTELTQEGNRIVLRVFYPGTIILVK